MSNTIYLYLKTHNKTGLQYFGMTKQDPYKYMGSGKRWRNHLSKHGNDVSTEIIFESENKEEIAEAGIIYSKIWDIVESDKFANLKIEEGDGGFDHINDGTEKHKERCRKAAKSVKNRFDLSTIKEYRFDQNKENHRKALDKAKSTESIKKKKEIFSKNKHQQGENNSQYGKVWCVRIEAIDYKERKKYSRGEIPEGWISCKEHRNKRKMKTNSAYGRHWYNDGEKNYFLKSDDSKIEELSLERGRIL